MGSVEIQVFDGDAVDRNPAPAKPPQRTLGRRRIGPHDAYLHFVYEDQQQWVVDYLSQGKNAGWTTKPSDFLLEHLTDGIAQKAKNRQRGLQIDDREKYIFTTKNGTDAEVDLRQLYNTRKSNTPMADIVLTPVEDDLDEFIVFLRQPFISARTIRGAMIEYAIGYNLVNVLRPK